MHILDPLSRWTLSLDPGPDNGPSIDPNGREHLVPPFWSFSELTERR